MEPRIRQFAARVEHLASRLLHGLANARVHARRVIRLRFFDVGGDIRAVVHGFLLGDELHHECARQNRLCLERLQRPVARHLSGQHGGQIIFDGQGFQLLVFHVVNLEHRHAGLVFFKPLRHKLRRAFARRPGRRLFRLWQGGLVPAAAPRRAPAQAQAGGARKNQPSSLHVIPPGNTMRENS